MTSWASLLLVGFMFWGLVGNLLVCLAINSDKRLQNVTNQFLFSLAIADLLVSVLVMPFSIMVEFHNGKWVETGALCTFYVYVDIFLCSASIVHMSIISLDRYMGIRYPLKPRNQSKMVVVFKILIVWLITICITSPIAALAAMDQRNVFQDKHCQVFNGGFIIYGSTLAFLIPLVIMVVTYIKTTTLLREQALSLSSANPAKGSGGQSGLRRSTTLRRTQLSNSGRQVRGSSCGPESFTYCHSRRTSAESGMGTPRLPPRRTGTDIQLRPSNATTVGLCVSTASASATTIPVLILDQCSMNPDGGDESPTKRSRLGSYCKERWTRRGVSTGSSISSAPFLPSEDGENMEKHRFMSSIGRKLSQMSDVARRRLPNISNRSRNNSAVHDVANEQKATRVLGIVFMCFFICWTPFFTLNFLQAFCHFQFISLWRNCSAPGWVASVTLWLGYISSTINPVIYTIFNKRFRQAFKRIIRCECAYQKRCRVPRQLTLTTANGTVHSLYSQRRQESLIGQQSYSVINDNPKNEEELAILSTSTDVQYRRNSQR